MKALNNIKFLCDATTTFNAWLKAIDDADSYEDARNRGNSAMGFIDCMMVYMNSMLAVENNDFTEQLDEVLEDWAASVYQHMSDKAIATNQPTEVVLKLMRKHDEIKEG